MYMYVYTVCVHVVLREVTCTCISQTVDDPTCMYGSSLCVQKDGHTLHTIWWNTCVHIHVHVYTVHVYRCICTMYMQYVMCGGNLTDCVWQL